MSLLPFCPCSLSRTPFSSATTAALVQVLRAGREEVGRTREEGIYVQVLRYELETLGRGPKLRALHKFWIPQKKRVLI